MHEAAGRGGRGAASRSEPAREGRTWTRTSNSQSQSEQRSRELSATPTVQGDDRKTRLRVPDWILRAAMGPKGKRDLSANLHL